MTHKNGFRADSYSSYVGSLSPNHRANIKVLTYAHAKRLVVMDKEGPPSVRGVTVDRFGTEMTFKARKEVVLSAGTMGSPKLMMLSGLGPKDHLQSVGIPVVKDMPGVGSNLHDHMAAAYPYYSKNTTGFTTNPFQVTNTLELIRYSLSGKAWFFFQHFDPQLQTCFCLR